MSATTSNVAEPSPPIPLDEVHHELARRLHALQQPAEKPVSRAHLSNLVVYCQSDERAKDLEQAFPAIIALHPARVLFLIGGCDASDEITATVRVRCHRSGDHEIISEEITLRAPGPLLSRLPFATRSLVLGDLPINLWWAVPEPPALAGPMLYDLGEHAQQILYDSIGWKEPVRGVVATATWLGQLEGTASRLRWRILSDLNWRRLKKWRRILAQALDPATAPDALASITEVTITHGPHAVVQAWELAAWLAASLGWDAQTGHVQPGVEIGWDFKTAMHPVRVRLRRLDSGPSNLRQVRIACHLNSRPDALNFSLEDEVRIAVIPEGQPGAARTLTTSRDSLAELVARQLSDRDRDVAFDRSMAVARRLGEKVLKG